MTTAPDAFSCPLCGTSPMQLLGNPHGEQYYRCSKSRCYGSRDVEGASFREEPPSGNQRRFVRTDQYGSKTNIYRVETAPQQRLEPIPGQPGLLQDLQNPGRVIMRARDFFVEGGEPRRGEWNGPGLFGRADPAEPNSMASRLEQLMISSLAAEPQRTIARMFALVQRGGVLPSVHVSSLPETNYSVYPTGFVAPSNIHAAYLDCAAPVNIPDPTPSKPTAPTIQETLMTDDAPKTKTVKNKIIDQGKDIGSAVLDGLAEATVEEAGDVLLDMAKEMFEGEALLSVMLASPDGRELVKSLMALAADSVAVHTSIPKAGALRKLAKYQFRSSARRVGGPRIGKMMKRLGKLVDLAERLPELPEGESNVVDFAASKASTAAR